MNNTMYSWKMTAADADFVQVESPFPELNDGDVLVQVAGCGVCHTDISFWHYGVKTKHELPLTLGHEISGTVVAGVDYWMGKKVVIPAVLPCGECELCLKCHEEKDREAHAEIPMLGRCGTCHVEIRNIEPRPGRAVTLEARAR